jgi:hypothetical protein
LLRFAQQEQQKERKLTYQIAVASLEVQALDGHYFIERLKHSTVYNSTHSLSHFLKKLVIPRYQREHFLLRLHHLHHDSTKTSPNQKKNTPNRRKLLSPLYPLTTNSNSLAKKSK